MNTQSDFPSVIRRLMDDKNASKGSYDISKLHSSREHTPNKITVDVSPINFKQYRYEGSSKSPGTTLLPESISKRNTIMNESLKSMQIEGIASSNAAEIPGVDEICSPFKTFGKESSFAPTNENASPMFLNKKTSFVSISTENEKKNLFGKILANSQAEHKFKLLKNEAKRLHRALNRHTDPLNIKQNMSFNSNTSSANRILSYS